MNFFKKMFSTKKEKENKDNEGNFEAIYSETYFNKRYLEQKNEDDLVEGSLKMIESYFIDNQIERIVDKPINHPLNLDQVIQEGMGFQMYCNAFKLKDSQIMTFLALAFSDFLITTFDFKLYKDNEPEYPLRVMTLKYDKNGALLSLYPLEYSLKVLKNQATFEDLYTKVENHLQSMPDLKGFMDNFIKNQEQG